MSEAMVIAGSLAAATVVGVGISYVSVAPRSTFWGPCLASAAPGRKQVALTFDDGPTPGTTERTLDILRDAGVHAAFFAIGVNVEKHPAVTRRVHAEGHLVCNHTYNHSHFGVIRAGRYWRDQLRRTNAIIESTLGVRPTFFRPPLGMKNCWTMSAIKREGHVQVTWSKRAVDGIPTTTPRILKRFAGVSDGDILLLHDGIEPNTSHFDRSATLAALPTLIESIRAKGLLIVRLDELLNLPPYQSRPAPPTPPAAPAASVVETT